MPRCASGGQIERSVDQQLFRLDAGHRGGDQEHDEQRPRCQGTAVAAGWWGAAESTLRMVKPGTSASFQRRSAPKVRAGINHENLTGNEVRALKEPDGCLGHVLGRARGLQRRRFFLPLEGRFVEIVSKTTA